MPELITSSSNKKFQRIRGLQTRNKTRQSEMAFVIEGVRLLEEAAESHWPMEIVLYDETLSARGAKLLAQLADRGNIEITEIPPGLMAEISDLETPQGILAVVERHALPLPPALTFVVIADQIRDPGNLGTLLRTAEAAGAELVLVTPGTVDPFAPKVIRAGMGAHFHLPILEKSWEEVPSLLKDLPVFLAASSEGLPLWEANLQQPCALLIGGEAFGVSPEGKKLATHKITIPMRGRAESLNAAVAGAILIAEVLRQRFHNPKESR